MSSAAAHLRKDAIGDECMEVRAIWMPPGISEIIRHCTVQWLWSCGTVARDIRGAMNATRRSRHLDPMSDVHQAVGAANVSGSSRAMEAERTLKLWKPSVKNH